MASGGGNRATMSRRSTPRARGKATQPAIGEPSSGDAGRHVPLTRRFFARPVLVVARELVGKTLVRATHEGTTAGRIVETEAYRGPEDRAAHSFGGRRTRRTEPMFGPAGHGYVFFVYGMHWCFNVVTGGIGEPHAVLIRAVEPLEGADLMSARRGVPMARTALTSGPARVCAAFGITGVDSGRDLTHGSLFVARGPAVVVRRSPRIGVDYAGAWASKPWRFFEDGNRWVTRPRR